MRSISSFLSWSVLGGIRSQSHEQRRGAGKLSRDAAYWLCHHWLPWPCCPGTPPRMTSSRKATLTEMQKPYDRLRSSMPCSRWCRWTYSQGRDRQAAWRMDMWTQGWGGERYETNCVWERHIYILQCVKQIASFWASQVGASGKKPACQYRRCKRCGLDPWVRKIPWRRALQPTPVFLPGESHGQRSLVGYSPWSHTESDMTKRLGIHSGKLLYTPGIPAWYTVMTWGWGWGLIRGRFKREGIYVYLWLIHVIV